jgi:hypothetical protein
MSPARPSSVVNVENRPPSSLESPPVTVPIHRLPSRAGSNVQTSLLPSAGVFRLSKVLNPTPLKRASPSWVPTQM